LVMPLSHSFIATGKIETADKAVSRYKKGDKDFERSGSEFCAHTKHICLSEDSFMKKKRKISV